MKDHFNTKWPADQADQITAFIYIFNRFNIFYFVYEQS